MQHGADKIKSCHLWLLSLFCSWLGMQEIFSSVTYSESHIYISLALSILHFGDAAKNPQSLLAKA